MKIKQLFPLSALTLSLLTAGQSFAATYEIREIPLSQFGANSFATGIDESGNVSAIVTGQLAGEFISAVRYPYNPVIDYSLINFEDPVLEPNLTDIESARAGNPNEADYSTLVGYVDSLRSSTLQQQFALAKLFVGDENGVSQLTGFDVINPDTGVLTGSTNVNVFGGAGDNQFVGVSGAPQRKLGYVDAEGEELTYLIRDFFTRAFVQRDDVVTELPPVDQTLGGWSYAYKINSNGLVAGATSVGPRPGLEAGIDVCADEETRGDQPVENCQQNLFGFPLGPTASGNSPLQLFIDSPDRISDPDGNSQINIPTSADFHFQVRGAIWELDEQGQVVSTRTLGLLDPPADEDQGGSFTFASVATSINDQGNAVGVYATNFDPESENPRFRRTNAVAYVGDEIIDIIEREDDFLDSRAIDINNQNQIIGMEEQFINGFLREKMFIYDLDDSSLVQPLGFFNGSDTIARDINDSGLIVGEGEIEFNQTQGSLRRREAFLYDVNQDVFQNMNDLVGCDVPYTLVEGIAINDNNEIAATAIVNRQLANPVTGEPIVDDNGDAINGSVAVAVKLVPLPGGEIDDCSALEEEEASERQGAGLFWGLAALFAVALRRRRRI